MFPGKEENVDGQALRRDITEMLLARIREEKYPSITMMNRVEEVVGQDREELAAYAEVLLDKVKSSRFPSIEMLNRLDRIAGELA